MTRLSERLQEALHLRNMKQIELSEKTGIGKSSISTYLSGDYEPKQRNIYKMASALDVSEAWLMGYDAPMERSLDEVLKDAAIHTIYNQEFFDLSEGDKVLALAAVKYPQSTTEQTPQSNRKHIPVLGDVAAGLPMEVMENIIDYEEISEALASTGEFFALRVKGTSMEPRMKEGDVVIIRKQEDATTGDTVVVLVNGDSATIKTLKKSDDGLSLIPNNPAFNPAFYTKKEIATLPITILGKVVELRAKF